MRTIDVIQGQSNRNQRLRLLMLLIIAGTFPFYCLGIFIIGSAPVERAAPSPTEAGPAPTFTPLGAELFASPSPTASQALAPTFTPLRELPPTPAQFQPPTPIPAQTIVAQTIISPSPTEAEPTATPAATLAEGPADADFDGVADDSDDCPEQFGYADNAGCPYPDDSDLDGIRDANDVCPQEFAPGTTRGCRDFDDDGLDTAADDCPEEAGPSANQGCPLPDAAGG